MKKIDSLGGAMVAGLPVVFSSDNKSPRILELLCPYGNEKEALELLQTAGYIKIIRPETHETGNPSKP